MKTYTVVALSVGGLGKKIFSAGDTVKENNFKAGRAAELVRQGFLEENVVDADKAAAEPLAAEKVTAEKAGASKVVEEKATADKSEKEKSSGEKKNKYK